MKTLSSITSRDNQRLKAARRVRDGKLQDLIFIEGIRLAEEAVSSGINVAEAFVDRSRLGLDRIQHLTQALLDGGRKVHEMKDSLFSSIADTENAQGIILIADRPVSGLEEIESNLNGSQGELVLCLIRISNPSNLGAVIRTAEAAGVKGVIASAGSADVFNPKALRGSMGSSFRLPICSGIEVSVVYDWARRNFLVATAADVEGTRPYTAVDWKRRRLLLFGSEGHGLAADELSRADELMVIPMENGVESLNLAVSAGIIMFEAKRQRAT